MKIILAIILLIILFFVIRFMFFCHRDFFVGYSMLKDDYSQYPFKLDNYYTLNKKQRDKINRCDKNYLTDVSEIMFKNRKRNVDIKDIYNYTGVDNSASNSYGFW